MSDISETIERLEQWVEHWQSHYPPEFIADLRALLNAAKAAQRAAELLQGAQRYEFVHDDTGLVMERCACGDLILIDDIVKAMQILNGECKE